MAVDDLSLPNTFIHKGLSDRAIRQLRKFSKSQLLELVKLWLNNAKNAPPILSEEQAMAIDDDESIAEQSLQIVQNRFERADILNAPKSTILREITLEFWSKGLNLFQVAEIESKYILEFQNRHSWTYSTFHLDSGEEHVPSIEPESFLTAFQTALYPMILGHTYITRHTGLSLTILRLQIFNPKPRPSSPLLPLRPIYLAFPTSSPHLLHSAGEDFIMRAVFHALQTILSSPTSIVTLNQSQDIPSKSLQAFAALKGISRHAASLGAWAVYAADMVDSSVLSLENHPKQLAISGDETTKRVQLANLRFHGDTSKNENKRQPVQIQTFEVHMKEPHEDGNFTPSLMVRLEGDDVFHGMYKLVKDGIADAETLPDWLTGEELHQSGKVENGRFIPMD